MTALDPALVEEPYQLQKLIGFKMLEWSEGHSVFELPIAAHIGNRYGIPHGGVYAMLLDAVMGYAGCYTGDPGRRQYALTLSMTTNYLSRPKGSVLIGRGTKTGGGARTFFTEGLITDDTGEHVASGTGVFRYRSGG